MRAFPLIQLSKIAIDGPTDRPLNRQPDRKTERQLDRKTDRWMIWMVKGTEGRWNGQTDRPIYIPSLIYQLFNYRWSIFYVSNVLSRMFLYSVFFVLYWTHQVFRCWNFSPRKEAWLWPWAEFATQIERLKSPCNRNGISKVNLIQQ